MWKYPKIQERAPVLKTELKFQKEVISLAEKSTRNADHATTRRLLIRACLCIASILEELLNSLRYGMATFKANRLRKEPLYARSPPVVVITYVSGYLAVAITPLDIILVIRVTGELLNLLDPFIDLIPHFDW